MSTIYHTAWQTIPCTHMYRILYTYRMAPKKFYDGNASYMYPLVQHHVLSLTVHLKDLKYSWQ